LVVPEEPVLYVNEGVASGSRRVFGLSRLSTSSNIVFCLRRALSSVSLFGFSVFAFVRLSFCRLVCRYFFAPIPSSSPSPCRQPGHMSHPPIPWKLHKSPSDRGGTGGERRGWTYGMRTCLGGGKRIGSGANALNDAGFAKEVLDQSFGKLERNGSWKEWRGTGIYGSRATNTNTNTEFSFPSERKGLFGSCS